MKKYFFILFLIYMFSPFTHANEVKKTNLIFNFDCFSEIENIYIKNNNFLFVDYNNSIEKEIIDFHGKRGFKCWNIISEKLTSKSLTSIPSPTILIIERNCTPYFSFHYYHFLEHLLGIWNFGGENFAEKVKLILMVGNGRANNNSYWVGDNHINYKLLKILFPNARIVNYLDFLNENKNNLIRLDHVIVSDRELDKFRIEPYHSDRMLAGYFYKLKKSSIKTLVDKVHNYYDDFEQKTDKIIITYIPRYQYRKLEENCENILIKSLKNIKGVEVNTVDFGSIPYEEQIKIIKKTDILIGAHGNGFCHSLFLKEGSTVIEFFPKNAFRNDYRIFSKLRNVNYFGWIDSYGWIDDNINCHFGRIPCSDDPKMTLINIDVEGVLNLIKKIIKDNIK